MPFGEISGSAQKNALGKVFFDCGLVKGRAGRPTLIDHLLESGGSQMHSGLLGQRSPFQAVIFLILQYRASSLGHVAFFYSLPCVSTNGTLCFLRFRY